ncbi:hypothetical protein FEA48_30690 [Pseudomonas nitroreducens]|uniref:Uncharacterized protein n=1 Tax=Pseudomonas nitroreducens TaxID=46680 RepID=A0A5R8ZQ85_PSENT|nr:hypothetical protein [Pseudomonas nitroreducens]TLP68223.1 hypothetical protein FEA48_30690 [Pseudomonas nitroreducens]
MAILEKSHATREPMVIVVNGVPTFAPGALDLIASWPFPHSALTFYLRMVEELHNAFDSTGASPKLHDQMKAQAFKARMTHRKWVT